MKKRKKRIRQNPQQQPKLKVTGSVYMPISKLARETGLSEKEAREAIEELNNAGLADIEIDEDGNTIGFIMG